jgi:hypothetical protein
MSGSTTPANTVVTPITQRILARVKGCTMALVNVELRAVTAEFLHKTLLWRERRTIPASSVLPGVASYALVPPQADAGTVAAAVLSAWYGQSPIRGGSLTGTRPGEAGEPRMVDLTDPLTVTLWPAPPAGAETKDIVLDIAWSIEPVTTTPDTLTLPYAALNHLDALTEGTLAKLFAMPDKPWSSTEHATYHHAEYRSALFQAREAIRAGRAHGSIEAPRWRFPRFA